MAERFGSQTHPSGGQRFGSQTYAAIDAVAGTLSMVEAGSDVFAGSSYPRATGAMAAAEAGPDLFAAAGISSRSYTLQAYESPAPDQFIAAGAVVMLAHRFGDQDHPLGGLRFGSQSWAALGPNGPMAATEAGSDTFAAVGWQEASPYVYQMYTIFNPFVNYSAESLASSLVGSFDTGDKVMLPVSGPGCTFEWEFNSANAPTMRLLRYTGATPLSGIPWFAWNGSWTQASFSVSDATQGAVFMVEAGADTFTANGSETVYGLADMIESGEDFVEVFGGTELVGTMEAIETAASDTFAADGAPGYTGDVALYEFDADTFAGTAQLIVTGALAAAESGADTFASSGAQGVTGSMAATEAGDDTLSSAGGVAVTGAMAATETATADTFAATGGPIITGDLAIVEIGDDAFASVGITERVGYLELIEAGDDTLAATGAAVITGSLAATDAPDTFFAYGQRESSGTLAAIETGSDRFVASGYEGDPPPPVPDFDGPRIITSGTLRYIPRSKRRAEAA
jgi:hypothetical protein